MSLFSLKLIALLSMLWDHITALWPLELVFWLAAPQADTLPAWAELLSGAAHYIGRIAAPIFLFALAQGYRHTKQLSRYALRLFLFACLAEWPYFLLFGSHGNILFTLLLGLLTLRLYDWGSRHSPLLGWTAVLPLIIGAEVLHWPEGQGRYLLFILVFYLTENWGRSKRAALWLFLYPLSRWKLLRLYFTEGFRIQNFILNGFGPLLGVALTLCYNGKKGPSPRGIKYLWYILYPAHLLVLALMKLYRGY